MSQTKLLLPLNCVMPKNWPTSPRSTISSPTVTGQLLPTCPRAGPSASVRRVRNVPLKTKTPSEERGSPSVARDRSWRKKPRLPLPSRVSWVTTPRTATRWPSSGEVKSVCPASITPCTAPIGTSGTTSITAGQLPCAPPSVVAVTVAVYRPGATPSLTASVAVAVLPGTTPVTVIPAVAGTTDTAMPVTVPCSATAVTWRCAGYPSVVLTFTPGTGEVGQVTRTAGSPGSVPHGASAVAVLLGVGGLAVVKSLALSPVSRQPASSRTADTGFDNVAAGPLPSKQLAVPPNPTRSTVSPAGQPPDSGVVESTSASLPLVADIAIVPVASGAGSGWLPPAPGACCTR
jgi:hypothetical protein